MKRFALVFALLAGIGLAHAADDAKPMTQQERMKACNKDATGKKGDERKQFMSACLKGKAADAAPAAGAAPAADAASKPMTQKDKMKACNKDATGKKGDERKQFMSECLKK
jgi:hypothetical protein